jgi:hypothetical protein
VDLDTTFTLALLQEEVDGARKCELKKLDYPFKQRQAQPAVPLLLPPPPSQDKSLGGTLATKTKKGTKSNNQTTSDNKVVALCAYSRA